MKPLAESTIGLIGAGNMAGALARGWLAAGLIPPARVISYDVDSARLQALVCATGITAARDNRDTCARSDVIVVATKPPVVVGALTDARDAIRPGTLVISIAPGISLRDLEAALPQGAAAVRVMPSTPCLVGAGASAYSGGATASRDQVELVARLFNAVGVASEVPESLMDAVTGLSGSGPAFVFIIIEALADGGVRAGLDRSTSLKLAAQTVLGSAQMVLETGEHPGRLKDQVASPGGTTIAGIGVLESRGVRGALMDAVAAAAARAVEMSKQ